jgi:hypothetical protein
VPRAVLLIDPNPFVSAEGVAPLAVDLVPATQQLDDGRDISADQ